MIGREAFERHLKRKLSGEELAAVHAVKLDQTADRRQRKRAIRKAIEASHRRAVPRATRG